MNDTHRYIGQALNRREDARLISGRASFVDDLAIGGAGGDDALFMVVVRSPVAHAKIGSIDAGPALEVPGVVAVVSGADLADSVHDFSLVARDGAEVVAISVPILALERVRFVGEPVAAVLATSRAAAEDGAEAVEVDYEPLEVIADIAGAKRGPAMHHDAPDNVLVSWHRRTGEVEATFASAAHVVTAEMSIPRLAAAPIEVRTCLAVPQTEGDGLTFYASAQDPARQHAGLVARLGRSPESVRVIVPDVGGAFGSKGAIAPEYVLAAWCALDRHRPVRYFEDRTENLIGSYQGRGIRARTELALDGDGRFLAMR